MGFSEILIESSTQLFLILWDCAEITCRFRLVLLPFNILENPLRVCNELRLA